MTQTIASVGALSAIGAGVVVALWTASEITALAVALAALMTATLSGIANILAVWRAEGKIDANTAMTAGIATEVSVVSGHVNSAATASSTKIDSLEQQVTLLRELLADQKSTAAVLAQSQAAAAQVAATPPAVVVVSPEPPKGPA